MFPEHRRPVCAVALEYRLQRMAFERQHLAALVLRRVGDAGHVKQRGHHVGQVSRRVPDRALLGDAGRPMEDQWRGDTALVNPVLVEPERRVRQVGPGRAVTLIGVLGARHAAGVVAEVHRFAAARVLARDHQLVDELIDRHPFGDVFGAGAVVGQEDDQRVVELAVVLQFLDDAAYALVHAVDLRGVNLHAAQQPAFVLDLGPGRLRGIARGQLPVVGQHTGFHQAIEALLAQRVPARVETAFVLGDVLIVRVQRPVRRGIGHVLEERRVGMLSVVVADEAHRLVADRIGVEESVSTGLMLGIRVAARQRVGVVEAAGADDGAVESVEAALQRPGVGRLFQAAGNMPLAAHVSPVAAALQHLGDRHALLVQVAGIALRARVVGQDADAGLVRMQTRQQGRTRRTAARRVVELRETQPACGQAV